MSPGNHDQTSTGTQAGNALFYDQYFPVSRFQGFPWYGGFLGKDTYAFYHFLLLSWILKGWLFPDIGNILVPVCTSSLLCVARLVSFSTLY